MLARKTEGFTLVELMIVVAIIGVLAALAVYGIARYLKHSKTAEATRNLGVIETGERVQYQRETAYGAGDLLYVHSFCSAAAPVPATVPMAGKIKSTPADWSTTAWTCLKFSLADPQFYSYSVDTNALTGTAANYTAWAVGDLDGNGTQSTFMLSGHGGPLGDAVRDVQMVINEDE